MLTLPLRRKANGFGINPVLADVWLNKPEGTRVGQLKEFAHYDFKSLNMYDDKAITDDHPAVLSYEIQGSPSVATWIPTPPTEEWTLVAVFDTEDGPEAIFAKMKENW